MTISYKDINAIVLDRAYANTDKASDPFYKIVMDHGTELYIDTNSSSDCLVILFSEEYYVGKYCA